MEDESTDNGRGGNRTEAEGGMKNKDKERKRKEKENEKPRQRLPRSEVRWPVAGQRVSHTSCFSLWAPEHISVPFEISMRSALMS